MKTVFFFVGFCCEWEGSSRKKTPMEGMRERKFGICHCICELSSPCLSTTIRHTRTRKKDRTGARFARDLVEVLRLEVCSCLLGCCWSSTTEGFLLGWEVGRRGWAGCTRWRRWEVGEGAVEVFHAQQVPGWYKSQLMREREGKEEGKGRTLSGDRFRRPKEVLGEVDARLDRPLAHHGPGGTRDGSCRRGRPRVSGRSP